MVGPGTINFISLVGMVIRKTSGNGRFCLYVELRIIKSTTMDQNKAHEEPAAEQREGAAERIESWEPVERKYWNYGSFPREVACNLIIADAISFG